MCVPELVPEKPVSINSLDWASFHVHDNYHGQDICHGHGDYVSLIVKTAAFPPQ